MVAEAPSRAFRRTRALLLWREAAVARRRPVTGLLLALSVLAGTACQDLWGPPPPLELLQDRLTLTRLGEAASVAASVDGRRTDQAELELVSEERWIASQAVLDPDSLAASRLVARAPGQAKVSVSAFDGTPAELLVRVAPESPVVVSFQPASVGTGDTLTILGYRLHQAGASSVRIDGVEHPVVASDSATLRVMAPPDVPAGECSGPAPEAEVELAGILVHSRARLFRRREGEIRIGVGDGARLPESTPTCLRLPPGGAYALAFWDLRLSEHERLKGDEGLGVWKHWVPTEGSMLQVVDRTGAAHGADHVAGPPLPTFSMVSDRPDPSAAASARASGPDECGSGDEYWLRETPLAAGDRFGLCGFNGDEPLWLRVFAVRGPLVLSFVERDSSVVGPKLRAQLDSAASIVASSEIPLLNAAYRTEPAVTFPSTGQILLYVGFYGTQGAAWSRWLGPPSGLDRHQATGYVTMSSSKAPAFTTGKLRVIVHELAHLWQDRRHAEIWNGERQGSFTVWNRWSDEGGADFLGFEAVRRFLGIGLMDNYDRQGWGLEGPYSELADQVSGVLGAGYNRGVAALLQDLVIRIMESSGASYEEALGAVMTGAFEGWYGKVPNGTDEPGLTERMNAYIPGWEPVDGVLTWTLSQAMDDRTDSPIYQNKAFYRAWQDPLGRERGLGWTPRAIFGVKGAPAAWESEVSAGTAGYFLIEAPEGASLLLEADSAAWAVGRYR